MKKIALSLVVILFPAWTTPVPAAGDRGEPPPQEEGRQKTASRAQSGEKIRGYADRNQDGVNDLFRDADGDGVDDVSGKPYPHRFRFVDADGDGINDLFRDADGDGVNDVEGKYADRDGDGICDNVVDYDGNGVNDITGLKYTRESLHGSRFGRIDEERFPHFRFVDEDGDGIRDAHSPEMRRRAPGMDYFIDEDGDGICDDRMIGRNVERRIPPHGRRHDREERSRRRGGR